MSKDLKEMQEIHVQHCYIPSFETDKQLHDQLCRMVFWRVWVYEWEQKWEKDSERPWEVNMYGQLFWKAMSVIEASVEKDKIEPTKTIMKQLFHSTYSNFESRAYEQANKHYSK